ncbi:MAG: ABC transporter ATP-binding protein [Gemmatimonadetes bacterium]|jgi:ABC-type multidrug transport system fused ATPase/permease subunit|nr:ABC transporter ATP-binding protein [Gemmatimonadota bacterium]MBT4610180.1 ABC transporter ATP-binding protein [Gemmatimonadota bacterium]MBT5060102.1 ABC transporter ATP-binding protein [Gemmatimonadota bacterium]MBT5144231.1 ABC transporter ATP-binding protein [Gemmatimonadota bacterium]MBT5588743.1 ABC transporter ATP-binding protein [Gemmatimonadota bacterium]
MSFLRQFWHILGDCRRLLGLSVLCGLAFAGANLLPPLLIRELILWITEGGGSASELLGLSGALLGVYLVRGVTRYGYGRFSHAAAYRVMDDLMVRVYRHVQSLPHRFFARERTGSLITRSVNDIEAVEDFIAHGVPETILAFVIPTAMIGVLFSIDAELTLITLAPIPIAGFLVFRFVRRVRQMWRDVRSRLSELVAVIHDQFAGMRVIKSFVQEESAAARVTARSAAFRDASIQANSVSLMPAGIVEAAGGIGIVLVIWSGGTAALADRISIADLFVFIVYMAHIYQPFLTLASINDVLQKASVSTDRVFQLLAVESDIVDAADARIPSNPGFSVHFNQVTFGYDPAIPVLHDISFVVPEGQIVALVGHTGAGKTTISHLLPRYDDPQAGSIHLGDEDLRQIPLEWLRTQIATVEQDIFLFHGSIADNIRFGRPDANDQQLRAAADAANASEFIDGLEDGFDTLVGERGVRLSGGQKQRLAIARALLKDAPVLILDEATSAVDSHTELLIQEALQHLMRQRTTLVIAHRLSTVRHADSIVVLDQGQIAEQGHHEQLLSAKGRYHRMIEAQQLLAHAWMPDDQDPSQSHAAG